MKSPFWVNEVYSLGYWLKDYGYYPKSWPLFSFMDHGTDTDYNIHPFDVNNDAPMHFVYSPGRLEKFKKAIPKHFYCVMNPFMHCRLKNKIEQSKDAKGTIFFPAHSTPYIDDLTDWQKFISMLENVPDIFKPIDISLHQNDMDKGLDKIFIKNGFKVYTAGDPFSVGFAEKFYSILKNYKYSMSNSIGSHTFYSVEMGIPFSLYGQEPVYFNKGDINVEKGSYTSYKEQPTYQKAIILFSGFHTEVTKEQSDFVNFELGKGHSISRIKTCYLLYKTLALHIIKQALKNFARISNNKIVRILKQVIKKIFIKKEMIPLSEKERSRLQIIPRYTATETIFFGKIFKIPDACTFLGSYDEIFKHEIYKFETKKKQITIIDCGANIGLATIYFRKNFPAAKIEAFEPDPNIFKSMKENILNLGYDDIVLRNEAVSDHEDLVDFYQEGGHSGMIVQATTSEKIVSVKAIRLKDVLRNYDNITFLKIDIEGHESNVIPDIAEELTKVDFLFLEYHSFLDKPQNLDELLIIIKNAGFRYYIKESSNKTFPFIQREMFYEMDLLVNIFCYKNE
jgi:FkbM family methyltransferase